MCKYNNNTILARHSMETRYYVNIYIPINISRQLILWNYITCMHFTTEMERSVGKMTVLVVGIIIY